jgi:hypothetical protein
MDDIMFKTTINATSLTIQIEDFGDRLDDYEPYWKWKIEMNNSENQLRKSGPDHGFFSKQKEAIEDCLKELTTLFDKKEILSIKKQFLALKKIQKIKSIILNWNVSSGSLESDAAYVEQILGILKITKEPGCTISEKEKLTCIFDALSSQIEPNSIQTISEYLYK